MSVCEICVKLGRVLIKDLVHIYTKPDQILELPAIVLHTGPHRKIDNHTEHQNSENGVSLVTLVMVSKQQFLICVLK